MDVVVTVPKSFGWAKWLDEGDLPGDPWSGLESWFYLGGYPPKNLRGGDRVYVVFNGKLRGYAPLTNIRQTGPSRYALVRRDGAVVCTIKEEIKGFRGFRYRWWEYGDELPFPNWRVP